jgi:hypothetical protein
MSIFDLDKSIESAESRLTGRRGPRRADAGASRLAAPVLEEVQRLLGGSERPPMRSIMASLRRFCTERGLRVPSRATLYRFMADVPIHEYVAADLPVAVQASLYNLGPDARIPGHQLAFYAFNYGDARAMSFAAGLPWLDLYQAARMRGWRAMSLGPLRAAMRRRRIE